MCILTWEQVIDDFHPVHPDRISQLYFPPGKVIPSAGSGICTGVAIYGSICFKVGVCTTLYGGAEQGQVYMTCNNHISNLCSLGPFIFKNCPHTFSLLWRHNGGGSVSNHQPHDCLHKCLFRYRWKKTSKLCVTGLCAGNSPGTGQFPAQMASNAANVSIWWRHHAYSLSQGPL